VGGKTEKQPTGGSSEDVGGVDVVEAAENGETPLTMNLNPKPETLTLNLKP